MGLREGINESQSSKTVDNLSLILGVGSVFLGGGIGAIPIIAAIVSGIALTKEPRKRKGYWKPVVGLILGVVFTAVYLYNYGYFS